MNISRIWIWEEIRNLIPNLGPDDIVETYINRETGEFRWDWIKEGEISKAGPRDLLIERFISLDKFIEENSDLLDVIMCRRNRNEMVKLMNNEEAFREFAFQCYEILYLLNGELNYNFKT
jgi:hypothetical protein